MDLDLHCPVCGSPVTPLQENHAPEGAAVPWFRALCLCGNCGQMKIDGIMRKTGPEIVHFHPACTLHGLIPVVTLLPLQEWKCTKCHRDMRVTGGKILHRTFDPPPPLSWDTFRPAPAERLA
jgi:hypothetical protein